MLSTDSTQVYRSSFRGAFTHALSTTSYALHSLIALCCFALHSLLTALRPALSCLSVRACACAKTQLILIAESVAVKTEWVTGCFALLDRAASALALAATTHLVEAEAQLLIDKNLQREGEIAFEVERSEQRRIVRESMKAMEEEYDDLRRTLEVQKAVSREEMAKRARQAEEEFAETKRQLELQKAISREEMAKRAREAEAEFEAAKVKADEEYKKEMLRGQAQLDELIRTQPAP